VGLVLCALAGEQRRFVTENLRRVRGDHGVARDAIDTARTFATYASCLAETLGASATRGRRPGAIVRGDLHVRDALKAKRGLVFATVHTAGWEAVGPLLGKSMGLRVMIAEHAERDAAAGRIQDDARRAHGVLVTHVGGDPFSALPLVRHLRDGGVVALQVDRVPPGVRSRPVRMFGECGQIPEGPLRLAALTGAPLLPVFASRVGHRRYAVDVCAPIRISRHASGAELDGAAQALADAMRVFLHAHPTQWLHFGPARSTSRSPQDSH
jgi:lauroyl/myristoyl acyltransferase